MYVVLQHFVYDVELNCIGRLFIIKLNVILNYTPENMKICVIWCLSNECDVICDIPMDEYKKQ